LGDNTEYIRVHCGAVSYGNVDGKIVLSYGKEPVPYEAYKGTTISITFPDAAGTVYGGTLTINEDGSGGLSVEEVSVDLGQQDWVLENTPNHVFRYIFSDVDGSKSAICSAYKVAANNQSPGTMEN
jgi:hypothetical protein